jgi:hypothetical protein
MAPAPEVLPPFWEVNHRINFIDLNKRYHERHMTCPQALEQQLREKALWYECTGWWVRRPAVMVCPLLCLAKKDGTLRTIIDMWNCNANMILNVTPMPDMRSIMDSLARNTYQSKINMADAYEQIHVELECVP